MSGFVLPKDARDFFKHVLKRTEGGAKLDTMFDAYYLCVVAGLDRRLLGRAEDLEGDRFIEKYPTDYQAQADVLAGLLINAELERKGIDGDDRGTIEQEMLLLLDSQSPTRLSEKGMELLNLYAASGFKSIQADLVPPQSLEEFLVFYHDYWMGEPAAAV